MPRAASGKDHWGAESRQDRRPHRPILCRYFFLGTTEIFVRESSDTGTFGFSFFGFLASRVLRS